MKFTTVVRQAQRYGSSIRGMKDQSGGGAHLYHKGIYVEMHSKPVAAVEEYDQWIAAEMARLDARAKVSMTGTKLRRAVVMRSQGSSWRECGDAVGIVGPAVKRWIDKLPTELQP